MEIIVFILFFVMLLVMYGWVLAKNDLHRFREYYFNNCDLEILPKFSEQNEMTGDYLRLSYNKERFKLNDSDLYTGIKVTNKTYLGKRVSSVAFYKESVNTYIMEVTYEDK